MSSKSVARSAGLRSIRRGRQVAVRFRRSARFPPTGRPVRSGLARWFRLYQFSSFRSVRSFVACSSSPAVLFACLFRSFLFACSVCFRSFLFVRLVPSACSRFRLVLFACLSVLLVPGSSRSSLVRFRLFFVPFGSCSVELVLCSRLLACRFYLYYSRVYYTLNGRKGK